MLRLSGLDNFYYLPMLHDMRYKGPRLSEIIRNTYHCAPSQGMTGEEQHNFCKFLYSQIQSKDEEISCLIANIKELTDQTRAYRY